ncbi:MAG: hypothetical protein AB7F23_06375 [Phycisphaerae bacterium]|jgi:hypothetical protein
MRQILLAIIFCGIVCAQTGWKTYEVYRPEMNKFVVSPRQGGPFNDHSTIVQFQGLWHCFWLTRQSELDNYSVCCSTSGDLRRWGTPRFLFESTMTGERVVAYNDGDKLLLFHKDAGSKLLITRYNSPAEVAPGTGYEQVVADGISPNAEITIIGRPFSPAEDKIAALALVYDMDSRRLVTITGNYGSQWKTGGAIQNLPAGKFDACMWRSGADDLQLIIKPLRDPSNPGWYYSSSADLGEHWSIPVKYPCDFVQGPMDAFNAGPWEERPELLRNYLLTNDCNFRKGDPERNLNNLALFTSLGEGFDLEAGVTISKTDPVVYNPSCDFSGDTLAVSYTSGAEERVIKAVNFRLPEADKYYIYPRSTGFPDTDCPEKRGTYYHFAGEQYCSATGKLRVDESGASIAAWLRSDLGGVIFSNLTLNGADGFCWRLEDGRQVVRLSGAGELHSDKLSGISQWTMLGVRIDSLAGEVYFYQDGKFVSKASYEADALKYLTGGVGILGKGEIDPGFSGDLRYLALFNGSAEADVLRVYSKHCWELTGRNPAERYVPNPEATVLEFEPADAEKSGFVFPADTKGGVVEYEEVAGRKILHFNGQSSAGLDIDFHTRKYGDYFQAEFMFRMEADEDAVLCTFGDIAAPVEVVARGNAVYMIFRGNRQVLGEIKRGAWNSITIFTGGSISRAKMNNHEYAQISHLPTANWFYLGRIAPTDEYPRTSRFAVDVGSVRTRILEQDI